MRDLYDVLGIPRTADQGEIKRAYRTLALRYHPDRNPGSAEAAENFRIAAEAFGILSDPNRRVVYDVYGSSGLRRTATGSAGGVDSLEEFLSRTGSFSAAGRWDAPAPPAHDSAEPQVPPDGEASAELGSDVDGGHARPLGESRVTTSRFQLRSLGPVLGGGGLLLVSVAGVLGAFSPATPVAHDRTVPVLAAALASLALVAVGTFLCSWLLSYCSAEVLQALSRARRGARGIRLRGLRRARHGVEASYTRAVDRWRRWTSRPIAVQLQQLVDAVARANTRHTAMLEQLEVSVTADIEALRYTEEVTHRGAGATPRQGSARERAGFGHGFILLLIAAALAALHVSLLEQALRTAIPPDVLLPGALAGIEASRAAALVITLCTAALGLLIRAVDRSDGNDFVLLFISPSLLLLGLAASGAVAYSSLATQIDLPSRLGIGPEEPLYMVAQHLLSFAGAVLPLVLVALGNGIADSFRQVAATHSMRSVERASQGHARRLESLGSVLERTRTHLGMLGTGLRGDSGAATAPEDSLGRVVAQIARDGGGAPRPYPEMIAALVFNLLSLGLWGMLSYLLLGSMYSGVLASALVASRGTALVVAFAVALTLSLAGFLVRDARFGSRYAAVAPLIAPTEEGRRLLLRGGICLLVGGVVAAGWMGAEAQSDHGGAVLGAGAGMLTATAVFLVAFNLDAALASCGFALYLAGHAVSWVGCSLAGAALRGTEGVLIALEWIVRLVSMPGEWLRSFFELRHIPASEASRQSHPIN